MATIQRSVATLDTVSSVDALHAFAVANDPIYDSLKNIIFAAAGETFQLETTLKELGNITYKGVDDSSPFPYNIEGEVVTHTVIVRYDAENETKPGLNGSGLTIYLRDKLVTEGATISGPDEDTFILIEKYIGESSGVYEYRVRPYQTEFIDPAHLSEDQEWTQFNAPSSREGSRRGPSTPVTGVFSRVANWNSIRVSDTIGAEAANIDVAIYDLGLDSMSHKVFMTLKEENLHKYLLANKQRVIRWGKHVEDPSLKEIDSATLEILREADGLDRQRGGINTISEGLNLDLLLELIALRASQSGGDTPSMNYTVLAGTVGYGEAARQIREKMITIIASNVTPGSTSLTGGFAYNKIVDDYGRTITFVLDTTLDEAPVNRIKRADGFYVSSAEWHVYNTGKTSSGKHALEYRYVKNKHDLFVALYGPRGASATRTSEALLPGFTGPVPTTSMLDSTEISALSDFTMINKDAWSSFVMREPTPSNTNY